MSKTKIKLFAVLLVLAFLVGLVPLLLPAPAAAAPAAFNVLITPNKKEYYASPGQQLRGSIKVRNDGDEAITDIVAFAKNFTASDDESGDPRILDELDGSYRYQLAEWLSFSSDPFSLAPNESTDVEYLINVPADAEPGGHYAILYIRQQQGVEGEASLGFLSQIGSLLLVTVTGEVDVEGDILEFYTGKKLYEYLPVDFYLRMKNTGNVHYRPGGSIFVRDWQNRSVGNIDLNSTRGVVLPESIRKYQSFWTDSFLLRETVLDEDGNAVFKEDGETKTRLTVDWKKWNLFRLGKYTAQAMVAFDDENQEEQQLIATTEFWVIPWKLILMIVGGIFVLTLGLKFVLKWYNQRLISKYERAQDIQRQRATEEIRKRLDRKKKRDKRRSKIRETVEKIRSMSGPGTTAGSNGNAGGEERKRTAFEDSERLKWEADEK